MADLVAGTKTLRKVALYRRAPTFARRDVVPFVFVYAAAVYLTWMFWTSSEDAEFNWGLLFLPIAGVLHALLELSCQWSVDVRALVAFSSVSRVDDATFVKVVPFDTFGKADMLPLERPAAVAPQADTPPLRFVWCQQVFLWNKDASVFEPLDFPISLPISDYQRSLGTTGEQVDAARRKWGRNEQVVPPVSFEKLFKEQLMAPFFVFQVFCVLLWCLDEYWQYSLMTLGMLLMFEATMVKQRMRHMKDVSGNVAQPVKVNVYRNRHWESVMSNELVPGDIVSLVRTPAGSDRVAPCDALILRGSCIVDEALLTGESLPQLKECIEQEDGNARLDIGAAHRSFTVFAGTKILQHKEATGKADGVSRPPDRGAVAYVLRTGFDTAQGSLLRTILYASQRMTANSREALYFILLLLVFAIAASYHVMVEGLKDPSRSRYSLLLNCTMIITSVVPPELPMELSLAVNTSLLALLQKQIFCTEPFRIPFAGKLNVCCFDKTGTLTTDEMLLQGVATLADPASPMQLTAPTKLSAEQQYALAGCHSLVFLDNQQAGDPMEKATLQGINWTLSHGDVAACRTPGHKMVVKIVHRYVFSSALKRMACILTLEHVDGHPYFVVAKGAPETIGERLASVPAGYEAAHRGLARNGYRVLAFAYRPLTGMRSQDVLALTRDDVESRLIFGGFLAFGCPLKKDAPDTIVSLRLASNHVVMITGDALLTACQVAGKVGMSDHPQLLLTRQGDDASAFEWRTIDETRAIPMDSSAASQLWKEYDLAVDGSGLDWLRDHGYLSELVPRVTVWARVSPTQKELILTELKKAGCITLMCGDGTNDVGALKQAHVGVALLSTPPPPLPPRKSTSLADRLLAAKKEADTQLAEKKAERDAAAAATSAGKADASASGRAAPRGVVRKRGPGVAAQQAPSAASVAKAKRAKARAEMMAQLEKMDDGTVPSVRFGDASIASPFTARTSSPSCVLNIVQQGRSTLVATMIMYKILAVNCLITAYSLSALYLDNVKLSDSQVTFTGILIAISFLFISRAKPLDRLAKQRPPSSIFTPYVLLSIFGQFAIHLACLIASVQMAKTWSVTDRSGYDPDGTFAPNLVNSVVYVMSCGMQVATFAVNYRGHPFAEGLAENTPLMRALAFSGGMTFLMGADMIPPLTSYLELVPWPHQDFRLRMLGLLVADVGGAWLIERVALLLFPYKTSAY